VNTTQKSYKVVIAPKGWTFDASSTMPLLLSAEGSRLRLPSSCRNGTCRTCMCRLLEGRIRYEIEWPGLSVDEKREGYILPCVAYPESDLLLEDVRAQK
jgi:ferredoxin